MDITNVNISQPGQFFQGVRFQFEGRMFSANIGLGGRPSSLYVFGAVGDDCTTTSRTNNPELLAEIERIARAQ